MRPGVKAFGEWSAVSPEANLRGERQASPPEANPCGERQAAPPKGGISSDILKFIAMLAMTADHVGAALFPEALWLRLVGRIAFPIYIWLLVMGFAHTSNLKKYLFRMGAFALLSEVPFDLAISDGLTLQWQNIYFTLFLCLLMMAAMKGALDRGGNSAAALAALAAAAAALTAEWLRFDYGCTGPVLAAAFYLYWRCKKPGLYAGFFLFSFSNLLDPVLNGKELWSAAVWSGAFATSLIESFGAAAVPLIQRCSGRRKWKRGKVFFYLFYPLHLLILYGIRWFFF